MGLFERRRKEAESFTQLVEQKGRTLREYTYEDLLPLRDEPVAGVVIGNREGTIAVIIEECAGDRVRVVVQGFIGLSTWVPGVKVVSLYGSTSTETEQLQRWKTKSSMPTIDIGRCKSK